MTTNHNHNQSQNHSTTLLAILELFQRDQEPSVQKYYQRLRKAYNRVFNNKIVIHELIEYDILYLFVFHTRHLESRLRIGSDDFMDNVYILSHDSQFQEDLIGAFEDLYYRVVERARIPFFRKQGMLNVVRWNVLTRLLLENRFEAFVIFLSLISTFMVLLVNTMTYGILGFCVTLAMVILVFYFAFVFFGRNL
jgi:hypothetical protein